MSKTIGIGVVEKIEFRGELYPPHCSWCGRPIGATAEVYPAARVIFCSTDCAALWFSGQLEAITSIKDENEGEEGNPDV